MNVLASFSRAAVGRPGRRVRTRLERVRGAYRLIKRWQGDYGPARRVLAEYGDRSAGLEAWRAERERTAGLPMTRDLRTDCTAGLDGTTETG